MVEKQVTETMVREVILKALVFHGFRGYDHVIDGLGRITGAVWKPSAVIIHTVQEVVAEDAHAVVEVPFRLGALGKVESIQNAGGGNPHCRDAEAPFVVVP